MYNFFKNVKSAKFAPIGNFCLYGTCTCVYMVCFSCSCFEDGELKYLAEAKELGHPERNTLTISFLDLEEHSTRLANVIQEHYYRLAT